MTSSILSIEPLPDDDEHLRPLTDRPITPQEALELFDLHDEGNDGDLVDVVEIDTRKALRQPLMPKIDGYPLPEDKK